MFKRTVIGLAAAAGLAAAGLAAAPAASAAPAGCPSGALCAYWSSNYGGTHQQVFEDNNDLTMYDHFYYMQGGSLYNNGTQCNVVVYAGTYHGQPGYQLNRGTGWKSVGSNLPHVESNYWC